MFEKIRKMKNKKGFTLVELIVVLVILVILAALLIPALTGYIDKANKEKVVSECRMVVMAAQTEASELYGKMNGGKLAWDSCTIMVAFILFSTGTAVGLLLTLMALMARLPRGLLLTLIPRPRLLLSN